MTGVTGRCTTYNVQRGRVANLRNEPLCSARQIRVRYSAVCVNFERRAISCLPIHRPNKDALAMGDTGCCLGPVLAYKARLQEFLLQYSQKSKIAVPDGDCHTEDVNKGAVGPTRDLTSTEPCIYVESCRRNILHRDLLVPSGSLCHLFGQPQPPQDLIQAILKLHEPDLPRALSCNNTKAGLAISFDRAAFFNYHLSPICCAVPNWAGKGLVGDSTLVVLSCACIGHIVDTNDLPLSSLRAVLLAHHMGKLLKRKG
uniref:Uncharacterized protein n=2 Tax=Eptatretus burgeri TaxID=7764 RepID=A0A8C4Q7F6_EPTBU